MDINRQQNTLSFNARIGYIDYKGLGELSPKACDAVKKYVPEILTDERNYGDNSVKYAIDTAKRKFHKTPYAVVIFCQKKLVPEYGNAKNIFHKIVNALKKNWNTEFLTVHSKPFVLKDELHFEAELLKIKNKCFQSPEVRAFEVKESVRAAKKNQNK